MDLLANLGYVCSCDYDGEQHDEAFFLSDVRLAPDDGDGYDDGGFDDVFDDAAGLDTHRHVARVQSPALGCSERFHYWTDCLRLHEVHSCTDSKNRCPKGQAGSFDG